MQIAEQEILMVVASLVVRCCAIEKNVIVASLFYDVADVQFTVGRLSRKQWCPGLWSRKSHHPTPTPTPGNFDYPTPTPTPTFSCISYLK